MAWHDDETEIRSLIKDAANTAREARDHADALQAELDVVRTIAEKVEPLRIRVDDLEARVAALEG